MLDFKKSSIFSEQLVFIKNLVYCHHLNLSFTVNCVLIKEKFRETRNSNLGLSPFQATLPMKQLFLLITSVFHSHILYLVSHERASVPATEGSLRTIGLNIQVKFASATALLITRTTLAAQ